LFWVISLIRKLRFDLLSRLLLCTQHYVKIRLKMHRLKKEFWQDYYSIETFESDLLLAEAKRIWKAFQNHFWFYKNGFMWKFSRSERIQNYFIRLRKKNSELKVNYMNRMIRSWKNIKKTIGNWRFKGKHQW
jgi:hypothetical protein